LSAQVIFRKVALGTWKSVGDPTVYGLVEFDATPCHQLIEKTKGEFERPLSLTSLVGAAVAQVLKRRPEINAIMYRGGIRRRSTVDLFFQVTVPGQGEDPIAGSELKGLTVRDAATKSLRRIHEELSGKVRESKAGKQNELDASLKILALLPTALMAFVLKTASWLNYDVGVPLGWMGFPKDAFGSVMITNVGSLGISTAWAPLVPFTRVPMLLTIGAAELRPWVVDGRVEARPVVRMGITFDHRLMDGVHAAEMQKIFLELIRNPELLHQLNR
jgi:pyruvate/2-oxoglutarate dehydrogenase complex dihydrolipoamide acyltransferase (E2) component